MKIELLNEENKNELIDFIQSKLDEEYDDWDYETPMHLTWCLETLEKNDNFIIFREESICSFGTFYYALNNTLTVFSVEEEDEIYLNLLREYLTNTHGQARGVV